MRKHCFALAAAASCSPRAALGPAEAGGRSGQVDAAVKRRFPPRRPTGSRA